MFFAVHALFTKPAQSLAPIIGWKVLSMYGISEVSAYETVSMGKKSRKEVFLKFVRNGNEYDNCNVVSVAMGTSVLRNCANLVLVEIFVERGRIGNCERKVQTVAKR
jgi:hypothetical protein